MFQGPWQVEDTGPNEYIVTDMEGRKLFYIIGDEGDDGIEPSILFHSEDPVQHALLVHELQRRLLYVP
jgi:hypothetical protein